MCGCLVIGSEIVEKFGVLFIEFNWVVNGIICGIGQIVQIVELEKWINEDGICDWIFDLVMKLKVIMLQGKFWLFIWCVIEQLQEGRWQECIECVVCCCCLIVQGFYIDEMEFIL